MELDCEGLTEEEVARRVKEAHQEMERALANWVKELKKAGIEIAFHPFGPHEEQAEIAEEE